MDRSLDDMIVDRQSTASTSHRDLDKAWIHDRYEDESRQTSRRSARDDRTDRPEPIDDTRIPRDSVKLRVDNLHYDLTEPDLKELFTRIGPIHSVEILYDRTNRSKGTAFVVYKDSRDAKDAIREFDGANAYGQPIRLTLQPKGPARDVHDDDLMGSKPRSLFDRISGPDARRRNSPARRSDVTKPVPGHIDRYVPGETSSRSRDRSPNPRRGGRGRRTGTANGRDSSRRGEQRADDGGRPTVKSRPRKTADELDAEMADYWGGTEDSIPTKSQTAGKASNDVEKVMGGVVADDDIDMIE